MILCVLSSREGVTMHDAHDDNPYNEQINKTGCKQKHITKQKLTFSVRKLNIYKTWKSQWKMTFSLRITKRHFCFVFLFHFSLRYTSRESKHQLPFAFYLPYGHLSCSHDQVIKGWDLV